MIFDEIKSQIIQAKRDYFHNVNENTELAHFAKIRGSILGTVKGELETLNKKVKHDNVFDDDNVLQFIDKLVKKFEERDNLSDVEKYEMSVLKEFLPEKLSVDDIEEIIDEKLREIGSPTMKDFGPLMKYFTVTYGVAIDGGVVSKMIRQKIQNQ